MPGRFSGQGFELKLQLRIARPSKMLVAFLITLRAIQITALAIAARAHHRTLFNIFGRWDANWYAGIAQHGYGHVVIDQHGRHLSDLAFFPLFPALEKFAHLIFGGNYFVAGIYVNLLAWPLAIWGIYVVTEKLADASIASLVTLLWAALPIALVQSMSYSESLFTALAAWSLYFLLQNNLVLAAALSSLAGATRPIGLALTVAVWVSAWMVKSQLAKRVLALLIAPIGFLGYFLYVANQRKNLFGYLQVQRDWGNGLDFGVHFSNWIWHYLKNNFIVGLLLLIVVAGLIYLTWLTIKNVSNPAVRAYLLVIVFQALTTASYFGSKPRYLLPAFPLLIPLARKIEGKSAAKILLLISLFSIVYGAFWLTGHGPP